jgi:hypothetical protein
MVGTLALCPRYDPDFNKFCVTTMVAGHRLPPCFMTVFDSLPAK